MSTFGDRAGCRSFKSTVHRTDVFYTDPTQNKHDSNNKTEPFTKTAGNGLAETPTTVASEIHQIKQLFYLPYHVRNYHVTIIFKRKRNKNFNTL